MTHQIGDTGQVAWANEVDGRLGGLEADKVGVPELDERTAAAISDTGSLSHDAVVEVVDAAQSDVDVDVDLLSLLRYPLYVSHRGGLLLHPEHSMAGYRASYESGFIPEQDIDVLSSGELVCIHDSTVDRTMTGVTGAVTSLTSAQWDAARIRPVIAGGKDAQGVYWEDVASEFGGRTVLMPELKNSSAQAALIGSIKRHHLVNSTVVQSFDYAVAQGVAQAGLNALFLIDSTAPPTTAAAIAAEGITWVGLSLQVPNTYIASCEAAGLQVLVWTVNDAATAAAKISAGADGVFTNDAWAVSGRIPLQSGDDFDSGYLWPGYRTSAYGSSTGVQTGYSDGFLNGTEYQFGGTIATGGVVRTVDLPWAGKLGPEYRIAGTLRFNSETTGGQTSNLGFTVYSNTDGTSFWDTAHAGQNGITFAARRNGILQAWKYVSGAAAVSLGASTASGQFAADGKPGLIDFVVTVSGSAVVLEVPQLGQSISLPNSFKPAGLTLALRSANENGAISNVRVTRL